MKPMVVCCGVRQADRTITHGAGCPGTIAEGDPSMVSHGLSAPCAELTRRAYAEALRARRVAA